MKKILQILLVGIVLIYIYNSYIKFKENTLFKITNINIEVENRELVNDLLREVEGLKGQNILKIEEDKIREKLLEDIRLEDIIIKKRMPDTLFFEIIEKKPFTYIEYKGKIYISDKKGIIFGKMRESEKYNMPLFRVTEEKDIKEFLEIMKKIDYSERISQIYKAENKIVITVSRGLKIITNSDVAAKKYDVVEKLYENEEDENEEVNIEYIDLRFKDYIIKRLEGDQR